MQQFHKPGVLSCTYNYVLKRQYPRLKLISIKPGYCQGFCRSNIETASQGIEIFKISAKFIINLQVTFFCFEWLQAA